MVALHLLVGHFLVEPRNIYAEALTSEKAKANVKTTLPKKRTYTHGHDFKFVAFLECAMNNNLLAQKPATV